MLNQVPVIGFNSGKYDINMVKEFFVKEISYNKDGECNEDVFVAKKENDYMFLITTKFKFLDVKSYIGPAIFNKIFGTKWSNPVKLDRKIISWYQFLRVF